jgi:hypothetical protein
VQGGGDVCLLTSFVCILIIEAGASWFEMNERIRNFRVDLLSIACFACSFDRWQSHAAGQHGTGQHAPIPRNKVTEVWK